MYIRLIPLLMIGFVGIASASAAPTTDAGGSQILVTVGDRDISATELQKVVASSPIATQFNTMDEPDQAMIRGRMLKNLIYSEMIYQQALAEHIDQRPSIASEIQAFSDNLLYKRYLQSLHNRIPEPQQDSLTERLQDDPDSLEAARAVETANRFITLKKQALLRLGEQRHLQTFRQPLQSGKRNPNAIVAKGDQLLIHVGDLRYDSEDLQTLDSAELLRRLDSRIAQQLMTAAARKMNFDISAQVEDFRRDLVRETLIREREAAWVPDRAALEAFYQAHPKLSTVASQLHVGQIVLADRAQAETLRQRILAGESLFALASDYSIDPYGRQHAGDMGWVRPDQAPEAIQDALKDLPDNTVSEVIKTPLGFHLLTVIDRKAGSRKPLNAVAAGIRRSLILEKLAADYEHLSQQYPIVWHLPQHHSQPPVPQK